MQDAQCKEPIRQFDCGVSTMNILLIYLVSLLVEYLIFKVELPMRLSCSTHLISLSMFLTPGFSGVITLINQRKASAYATGLVQLIKLDSPFAPILSSTMDHTLHDPQLLASMILTLALHI